MTLLYYNSRFFIQFFRHFESQNSERSDLEITVYKKVHVLFTVPDIYQTSKNVNAVNIRHVKAVAFYLDVQYILLQRWRT